MPKTILNAKQLHEQRNTSNVFNREVIIGLLRILNRKLVYQQIWDDTSIGVQNVTVPFFYDFGGSNINSERFIQDNYTFFTSDECTSIGLKKIDGNFDFYPQGRISLAGINIDSGNITNRFVMGRFTRYIEGKPKAFVAYLYSMPLQFTFNVEIRCENMNTAFKIDEAYRTYFYKNQTYHINYKGTVCPVRVGFPESALQPTSGATYTMGTAPNDNWIKLSMSLQCETYQPIFDPYSERPADSSIYNMGLGIWVNRNQPDHTEGPLIWLTDFEDMVLVSGQDVMLEWKWLYEDRDLLQVDLLYQEEGDENEYILESMDNHNFYHWRVPHDFVKNGSKIDIVIPNTDDCTVYQMPEIYIYPDPNTKIVDNSTVYVLNKGYFITAKPQVDCYIEYEDLNGKIIQVPAKLNLHNFMIDENDPIEFDCFVYKNSVVSRKIHLILRDHHSIDNKAISEVVTIV